ncbi:hypothetical protein Mapa_012887 [Marchantia paleacea]|nr:hypothetical protein Mapa_012887 [Marchantia paleacea]
MLVRTNQLKTEKGTRLHRFLTGKAPQSLHYKVLSFHKIHADTSMARYTSQMMEKKNREVNKTCNRQRKFIE